jgi:nitroimidazol reductase NimA-like FMN-containing flavoprotein (pyridoxamine 5'-phosphate oxidase superfamily)
MRFVDSKTGIEVLDRVTCLDLLAGQVVGRVAVVVAGRPVVLPVNYVLDGETVVFRTADGTKFDAAVRSTVVAFEVDETDRCTQTGWSVLVTGRSELVADEAERERLARLPLRPWSSHQKSNWVRIPIQEITGRRVS